MRRTKIICTIGPAVHSLEAIEQLIVQGMDAARLNFSHGSHEDHAQTMTWLREASMRLRKPVAVIADLQGPKIRTGETLNGDPVELRAGQRFVLTTDPVLGTAEHMSVTYPHLPQDVKPGDRILLDDGLLELKVLTTDNLRNVETEVILGGPLGEHKGINLPGVALRTAALTDKDQTDLEFALAEGVDYVALSFVRRAEDIVLARQMMQRVGRMAPLIAKIEKPEALTNLDAILTLSDAIMVARGDLGVELSPEQVPVVQKEIIRLCNRRGLPVIIATQMLNSALHVRSRITFHPPYDGHHIAIYVGNFSAPHKFLKEHGLVTQESDAHQYRFQSIVDPESGEMLFEIEHEVRSLFHPMWGRELVNRNPAQNIFAYSRGSDALRVA